MSAAGTFRVWTYSAVAWGETFCEAPGCFAAAELLADFDERRQEGVPLCVVDADRLLERQLAVEQGGRHAGALPDPWEYQRPPARPRPPAGPSEWEYADRTPEKWLAEQRGVDTSNPDWDIPW